MPQEGKPGKARCPTPAELEAQRKARMERELAARAKQQTAAPASPPSDGKQSAFDGEQSTFDEARARARQRVVRTSMEEVQRLRGVAAHAADAEQQAQDHQ